MCIYFSIIRKIEGGNCGSNLGVFVVCRKLSENSNNRPTEQEARETISLGAWEVILHCTVKNLPGKI